MAKQPKFGSLWLTILFDWWIMHENSRYVDMRNGSGKRFPTIKPNSMKTHSSQDEFTILFVRIPKQTSNVLLLLARLDYGVISLTFSFRCVWFSYVNAHVWAYVVLLFYKWQDCFARGECLTGFSSGICLSRIINCVQLFAVTNGNRVPRWFINQHADCAICLSTYTHLSYIGECSVHVAEWRTNFSK